MSYGAIDAVCEPPRTLGAPEDATVGLGKGRVGEGSEAGAAKEVALEEADAFVAEPLKLLDGLNALGDNVDS